jgi:tRNA pseudouridine55 synthase
MNGVLVVDKPAGPTSHDVVARVRRATGVARIGHTGTLDPLATGVLPLVLGRATRLAQFLSGSDKEYLAEVRFGSATSTYDAEGEPVPARGAQAVPADLRGALEPLLEPGPHDQMPPPFSAKKVGGTPAYRLARRNRPVTLEPVRVAIREVELVACSVDTATIRIVGTAGFYVRSFADELGQRLGCGAHVAALRRTRAGDFTLDRAVALAALEQDASLAAAALVPPDQLLPSLPEVVLTEHGARRAAHGNQLNPADLAGRVPSAADRVRMVDASGRLLGVAAPRPNGALQPVVVLV